MHSVPPRGISLRYARRAFFTMGDSPFFTTSASEFFIPLARAVFMTGRETCSSSSSHPQGAPLRVITSPLWPLSPCASRTAGAAPGFLFVLFLYEGLAPLAIAMPPRKMRGSHLAAALPRGISYPRTACAKFPAPTGCKVPCEAKFPVRSTKFPEANSLLLPPRAMRGELPHCSLCIVHCALPCFLRQPATFLSSSLSSQAK